MELVFFIRNDAGTVWSSLFAVFMILQADKTPMARQSSQHAWQSMQTALESDNDSDDLNMQESQSPISPGRGAAVGVRLASHVARTRLLGDYDSDSDQQSSERAANSRIQSVAGALSSAIQVKHQVMMLMSDEDEEDVSPSRVSDKGASTTARFGQRISLPGSSSSEEEASHQHQPTPESAGHTKGSLGWRETAYNASDSSRRSWNSNNRSSGGGSSIVSAQTAAPHVQVVLVRQPSLAGSTSSDNQLRSHPLPAKTSASTAGSITAVGSSENESHRVRKPPTVVHIRTTAGGIRPRLASSSAISGGGSLHGAASAGSAPQTPTARPGTLVPNLPFTEHKWSHARPKPTPPVPRSAA